MSNGFSEQQHRLQTTVGNSSGSHPGKTSGTTTRQDKTERIESLTIRQTGSILRRSLRSPLGKSARRARAGLLLVSVISLIATQTGLLPTNLLGPQLRFQLVNYMTLLKFTLFFNLVLLITFTTCALVDYLNWRLYGTPTEPPQAAAADTPAPIPAPIRLRLLVDLALPCLLGLYAIGAAVHIMYFNYITFSPHP